MLLNPSSITSATLQAFCPGKTATQLPALRPQPPKNTAAVVAVNEAVHTKNMVSSSSHAKHTFIKLAGALVPTFVADSGFASASASSAKLAVISRAQVQRFFVRFKATVVQTFNLTEKQVNTIFGCIASVIHSYQKQNVRQGATQSELGSRRSRYYIPISMTTPQLIWHTILFELPCAKVRFYYIIFSWICSAHTISQFFVFSFFSG